ncbi:MAG: hypothetical protein BRD27_00960, partial [Bacteroidetes bacterium QH_10_64_19]
PTLEEWIESHPEWKDNVLGQIKSWFDEGLKARAITRDVPWGVPVPEDVAERHGLEAEGKVIYVWFDAPIGYISATKEWARQEGDPERWRDYWQDDDTTLVHFIGKDNIVFHCLMFPAMLMEHGEYVLPENVPANEFLNLEGEKLSTSRGWAVWLHEYLDDFQDERHAPDLLRYALGATLPETGDADFSWEGFQQRVNGELANVFGNFVHRTLTFAHRYFDGAVPPLEDPSDADRDMLDTLREAPDAVGTAYEKYRTREAIFETMALAREGNKYFNETEPWHTHENDPQACANTIHVSLQVCGALSILFEPVPDADKLVRLEVDIGFEERQMLAGVAEQMKPDELIGLKVVVVANMAPKEMFGIESQGMVLMAEEPDGTFVPVTTEAENGSVVR